MLGLGTKINDLFFHEKAFLEREKKNTEKSHARNVKENLTEYPSNLSILS